MAKKSISFADLSNHLADVVEGVAPSVLRVSGRRRRTSSAVVWDESHVVTASHTVRRDKDLKVTLADGTEAAATLVGRDPTVDIAVLKVDAELAAPTWHEAAVRVGNLGVAIARTRGGPRATLGMVVSASGAWQTATGGSVDAWIEVDATLPRGGSGGALLDLEGRVIGLNTSHLTPQGAVLPTSTVKRTVERITKHGSVERGYLGVGVYPGDDGLVVVSVDEGGAAASSGLLVGDVITEVAGRAVKNVGHLMAAVGAHVAGETVKVTRSRGGESAEVDVELGARPRRKRRC